MSNTHPAYRRGPLRPVADRLPPGTIAARHQRGGAARQAAWEATIAYDLPQKPAHTDKASSWAYAEEFVAEDDVLLTAREVGVEIGCRAVQPGAGAVLRVAAAALQARAVVEIGTGTGVGALWLLRGMPEDGVLTTIDPEVGHQRAARQVLAAAGIAPTRLRAIAGRATEVLPRLADGGYDLVVVGGDPAHYPEVVEEGLRLLRRGGMLAVDAALLHDQVANPARRDELTTVVREVGRRLRDDDRVLPALLPSGDGLLLAVVR
ncbi:O-methyltransferase [Luteimicrobium subarcticum]|uniref:Putative O-methyltransferase YrrM n=1 Tax=Luteimicrobium subarcticum TaxID=620910 RepID=A0A2M8WUR8_9MICO|nr:O-methyltransferase [Luteimicrobium subarcticum]PJI94606.1 putative O-methyltransferase YrrM [Luteimicrobium subarcticum]